MTYARTGINADFRNASKGNNLGGQDGAAPASATSAAAEEAAAFGLWVSQQSTSLAKLKMFHTMAKSVNDQQ